MVKNQFGNTSLKTAPIIFGGNVFGWTLDEQQSHQVLDAFVDKGFNMIDTSNNYPRWVPGATGLESETILGKWMQQRKSRDSYVIATKVGGKTTSRNTPNTSAREIIREVELSLKRLKTDYIDLYQLHYDQEETPVAETLEAFNTLVQAGKVRYIGASNISASRLRASLDYANTMGIPGYCSLQPLYNLYDRDLYEKNFRSLAASERLAVTPYYSLASGFLTGKYTDNPALRASERGKTISKYFNHKGEILLSNIQRIAESHQVSMSAVALAWLLHQPTVTAPIASATKASHLEAFVEASTLQLSTWDLKLLSL